VRSQPVEIPAAAQKALQREQATGLLIVGVEDDSPAARDGLMVSDILVGIAGMDVTDHDALFAALGGKAVGKKTEIQVLRGGQPKVLAVVIGER
jgi:serine protease Do